MKKICIIFVIITLMSVTVFASSPSDWAEDYVLSANETGIMDNTDLNWQEDITREQYCELMYNMISIAKNPNWEEENIFFDTDNEKISALNNLGVIKGKSETEFCPDDLLTREEAATLLCRVYELYNEVSQIDFESYSDDDEISDWSYDKVYEITALGIMNGVGDNKFAPQDNYTIEQAVTTLVRLYDVMKDKKELTFADKMNTYMPKDKNYMFSPLSIKTAFLLASNGAEDETLNEILDVFGIDNLETANKEAREFIEKYSKSDILRLDIANSIWLNSDNASSSFNKNYEETVKNELYAQSRMVDNNNAVDSINNWVSEKTNGKINGIINTPDFESMLINAVYFKGIWEDEFSKSNTRKDTFTNRDGTETQVDFMHKTTYYNYFAKGNTKVIELPYKTRISTVDEKGAIKTESLDNTSVSMYLIMSDNEYNPVDLLENTDFINGRVSLYMPSFTTEYSMNLNDILKNMGIKKAFSGSAEFGKMFDEGSYAISDVLHKTYIKVDEQGTEAAAVTSITLGTTALPEEPIEVKFNKPFTYVIKDKVNGEILFVGEYAYAD